MYFSRYHAFYTPPPHFIRLDLITLIVLCEAYRAPHYAVFASLRPVPPPPPTRIFSSPPCICLLTGINSSEITEVLSTIKKCYENIQGKLIKHPVFFHFIWTLNLIFFWLWLLIILSAICNHFSRKPNYFVCIKLSS
jgi:hypothetical protein